MKSFCALTFTAMLLFLAPTARAEVWNLPAGGTWNDAASWSPASIPNSIGANATFNNAASGSIPAQTGNRPVTLDANQTVGSLLLNNDAANAFTTTISVGTPTTSTLIFDETGAGPATITANSITGATGNTSLTALMRLDDDLLVTVNNITASSSAGALTLTGAISGNGGLTKAGDGLLTLATGGSGSGTKTYLGPTVLNGGRTRVSAAGRPTGTSSFTINAGAQLDPISGSSYTFGANANVPLNLNGSGPTTGPFAAFAGAIRPDTSLALTITNQVVLQSDSMIHVQGSATGSVTLPGNVSGPGRLIVGAGAHDANLGQVTLGGTNSYLGGTTVQAGTLAAGASSITGFGSGNITVSSASSVFANSIARIQILSGATNAIKDTATLSLAGGNVAATADDGYADLAAGINETVGGLILGGTTESAPGTYGSVASGATFQFDEYFSGLGVITLAAPAGVAGDYNGNGIVDAVDYVVWRKSNGTNTQLQNEVSGVTPGQVTPEDYDAWRARFGNTSGSGSASITAAVPEPTGFALTALFAAFASSVLHRNRTLKDTQRA